VAYHIPDHVMAAICLGVERELGYLKGDIEPRALDPRIVAMREIARAGQAAYEGDVPEHAHGKTRSEQGGAP
jgi:hypothetical protein